MRAENEDMHDKLKKKEEELLEKWFTEGCEAERLREELAAANQAGAELQNRLHELEDVLA